MNPPWLDRIQGYVLVACVAVLAFGLGLDPADAATGTIAVFIAAMLVIDGRPPFTGGRPADAGLIAAWATLTAAAAALAVLGGRVGCAMLAVASGLSVASLVWRRWRRSSRAL